MSARNAFERCLRLTIVLGNTAAYRAGATCILRRHLMYVSAQSQRLPINLWTTHSCQAKCLSFIAEGDAGARMHSRSGRGPYEWGILMHGA